jgi:predicted transcriptional regulator
VLILELLTQHDEPRLVREIAEEVKQAHPDRDPSDQVVRNALNTLIAKGEVERQEQGNSVLYTAVRKAEEESKAVPEQASADPVLADA